MKINMQKLKQIYILVISAILLFILTICVFSKTEYSNVLRHSPYDSYTLQAMTWREGNIKLNNNYPWLELAVLNDTYFENHSMTDPEGYRSFFYDENGDWIEHAENEYYVSFPPFPSVPMLFLSFIFGENTPSILVNILYAIVAFIFAILICRRFNLSYAYSICGGILLTVSSSAFFLYVSGLSGSVWFMAQMLSLFLTTAAFYFIHGDRTRDFFLAFILLGFAVGCRPFQLLYYFYFAYVVWKKYNYKFLKTIKFYIPAALIGICYMVYNYVRFGSVMEFGHNYLPEMMLAPEGQFSLYYITVNYKDMFLKLPQLIDGKLNFDIFGFACWITNVLFIILVIALILKIRHSIINRKIKASENINERNTVEIIILLILIVAHFILTMMHKSLGMMQFGSRYTVDILPAALVAVVMLIKPIISEVGSGDKYVFNYIGILCMVIGGLLNISASYKYMTENAFSYSYEAVNKVSKLILISVIFFALFIIFKTIRLNKKTAIKETE